MIDRQRQAFLNKLMDDGLTYSAALRLDVKFFCPPHIEMFLIENEPQTIEEAEGYFRTSRYKVGLYR